MELESSLHFSGERSIGLERAVTFSTGQTSKGSIEIRMPLESLLFQTAGIKGADEAKK